MGDPISTVGTAVGIASLGIQVCQGLVSYYSRFRSFDHDIDGVLKRIDSLQQSLGVLDTVAKRVEIANSEESIQLRKGMDNIKIDLSLLEGWVKKCGQTSVPKGFQASGKKLLKQVYWPFKKETLQEMQSTIDRVQGNLQLSLQVFGVDAQSRQLKDVSRTITHVDARTSRHTQDLQTIQVGVHDILQHQLNQKGLIEDRSDQFIAQMSRQNQNLQEVELGMQHLSRQHIDNTTTLILRSDCIDTRLQSNSSDLQAIQGDIQAASQRQIEHNTVLLSQCTDLNSQLSVIEQHLALMVSHMSPAPVSHGVASDVFQDSLQQSHALLPIVIRNMRDYQQSLKTTRKDLAQTRNKCNCRTYLTNQWKSGQWISMHTRFKSKHWPTCAYFEHDDFEQYIEIRLNICTRALGSCISASLYYARQAGKNIILPGLQARSVVSENSPSFRGLRDLANSLTFTTGAKVDKRQFAIQLSTELDALRENFRRRLAYPSDTLPNGTTIMHKACNILNYVVDEGHYGLDEACNFLDALIAEGVPLNERDERELIPLDYLLTRLDLTSLYKRRRLQDSSALFTHLLRKSRHWILPTSFAAKDMDRFYYSESPASTMGILHNVAHLTSNVEGILTDFEMEYPLFFAVIQKSDTVLRELLISDVFSSKTFDLDYYWAVRYTMHWPDGLRQFLSMSSEYIKRHSGDLFEIAIRHSMVESLGPLIEAQLPISMDTWTFLCSQYDPCTPFHTEALSSIAKLLRNQTSDSGIKFYRTRDLSLAAAEALWMAGFQELDLGSDQTQVLTSPLDYHITALDSDTGFELLQWFVEKGVRLDAISPYTHSTVAHKIAERMFRIGTNALHPPNSFVRSVFESHVTDKCVCPCSTKGCLPIGLTISKAFRRWTWHDSIRMKYLYDLIDSSPDSDRVWMSSTCLRALTFEDLGMTHTCCCTRICFEEDCAICGDDSERRKLLAQPGEEIETLESLLKDFEAQLQGHQGKLRAFIKEVWDPKMKEVANAKFESWGGLWEIDIDLDDNFSNITSDTEWEDWGKMQRF